MKSMRGCLIGVHDIVGLPDRGTWYIRREVRIQRQVKGPQHFRKGGIDEAVRSTVAGASCRFFMPS